MHILVVWASDIGTSMSYQPHSYNDMRIWEPMLAKGWKSFKIDPNFISPGSSSLCLNQVNIQNKTRAEMLGCFLLNHDNPTSQRNNYNSSDDVLEFVATHADQFRGGKRYIALCFKNAPGGGCDGSKEAQGWLELVDDFFNRANDLIESLKLDLEFVLDGDGAPMDCKVDRWRPWNSTYISDGDPADAFWNNNKTLGYDRFTILNEPALLFGIAALAKYGKFASQSLYPFQMWEPSDQKTVLDIAKTYLSTGIEAVQGLLFATNSDPIQNEIYVGSKSGRAWNVPLVSEKSPIGIVAIPDIEDLIPAVFVFTDDGMYSVVRGANGSTGKESKSPFDAFSDKVVGLSSPDNETICAVILEGSNNISARCNQVTLSSDGGAIGAQVMSFSVQAPKSAVVKARVIPCHGKTSICIAAVSVDGEFVVRNEIGGVVQNVHLTGQVSDFAATSEQEAVFVGGSGTVSVATLSSKNGLTTLNHVHVGTSPSVAALDGSVLITWQDGYCWNTETRNKQPFPALCDQTPEATPGVLNYITSTFSALESYLQSQATPITPCLSSSVLFGTMTLGANPLVALTRNATGFQPGSPSIIPSPVLLGVVAHNGWLGADTSSCGPPLSYNGTMLDAWMLRN